MRTISSFTVLLIFISVLFYSGCKDTITGDQIDSRTIPATNVSYAKDIQPVLNLKCASSGCHDDITRASGYSLTTWGYTVMPPYVFLNIPGNSLLVQAIDPQYAVTSPMPPLGYAQLTQAQITGIETWIKEGAKNN